MPKMGGSRYKQRHAAALLVAALLTAGCGGVDASSDKATKEEATITIAEDATAGGTVRTTVATSTTFDLKGPMESVDVIVLATCLGVSTGRSTPEDAAIRLYNLITDYQDEGASAKDLETLDLFVTTSLVDHCGPELAGKIDKVRYAIND